MNRKNRSAVYSMILLIVAIATATNAQSIRQDALFRIVQDEKVGFINREGRVIVHPQFASTGDFREGFVDVYNGEHDGKFIDMSGKFLAAPEFDFTWGFKEGLAGVEIDGKWGFIDTHGKLAISLAFVDAGSFSNGLAPAAITENGKIRFGYINKTGTFVIKPQFVYASKFVEGIATVTLEGDLVWSEANLRMVSGNSGFIDRTGKLIIRPEFDEVCGIAEGLICVRKEGQDTKYGFISFKGDWVIKPRFKEANQFSGGLAAVQNENDKWGFVDRRGHLVTKYKFDDAVSFTEDLAGVKIGEKWGFIDKSGRIKIRPKFKYTYGFKDGIASVLIDRDNFALIDKAGRYVWKPTPKKVDLRNYPAIWFAPINDPKKPDWEILPQEAKVGEVILSKRNELGILSNFAATPFELYGKRYASVEGFWQMMLYPEGTRDERARDKGVTWRYKREQVAQMTAFQAKEAGTLAEENMKTLGIDWVTYQGKKFPYRSATPGEHYKLIVAAMRAKLEQNPEVKRILLATGDLILKPDHIQEPEAPPEWRYNEIWMQLRSELQKNSH